MTTPDLSSTPGGLNLLVSEAVPLGTIYIVPSKPRRDDESFDEYAHRFARIDVEADDAR